LDLPLPARKKLRHDLYTNLKTFTSTSSQIGDDRPLSCCAFAPNSQHLATGSWTGLVKLWTVPDCELVQTFRGKSK